MPQVHATCVAVDGHGVLLLGPSGSGKSDLALRLIAEGAELVADDRVDIAVRNAAPWASAPPALAGLIEVRGLGVLRLEHRAAAAVRLVVALDPAAPLERLPRPLSWTEAGVPVTLVRLAAREASAAVKVRLAVSVAVGHIASIR